MTSSANTAPPRSFAYRASDIEGAFLTGHLSAESRAHAVEVLRKRGLIAISVETAPPAGAFVQRLRRHSSAFWRPAKNRITQKALASVTESLAALLSAGLTIDRALQITAASVSDSNVQTFVEILLKQIRAGRTLFAALTVADQPIPDYYLSMIEAAEASGSLPQTLLRISELLTRQLEFRERIRSALIYPALLAVVVLFTLVVLLVFVLPRFEVLFGEAEGRLPWSTRAVLSVGRFAADYWWIFVAFATVGALSGIAWIRTTDGRLSAHRWLVRTRLSLGLPVALETARWLQTVSALCANGQPITSGLQIAQGTLANQFLRDAMRAVILDVQEGQALSVALARRRCFPPLAIQLARVGEETGRLPELLASAARVLERDAHRILERLLTIAVPLVTILMGMLVAALIGSVLIGLLSLNDLAF